MRSSVLVPALLATAFVTVGCSIKTSDRDLVYLNPYQAVEKTNATPGLFEREVRTAWVDPRRPEQYAAEHIPGAISLPFPRIPAEAKTVLKGYDQFVVYDTDFDDTIGKAAAKRLMEEGFSNVYSLEGGLKAWKRDGNPTDKAPEVPPAAKTQPGTLDAKAPAATPAPKPAAPPTAPTAPAPASPAAPAKPAAPPPAPAPAAPSAPAAAPPKA